MHFFRNPCLLRLKTTISLSFLVVTTIKIYTNGVSNLIHIKSSTIFYIIISIAPFYLKICILFQFSVWYKLLFKTRSLQRHEFSGLCLSAGELLRIPWLIPASMATAQLSMKQNAFFGIQISEHFGTLTNNTWSIPPRPSCLPEEAH